MQIVFKILSNTNETLPILIESVNGNKTLKKLGAPLSLIAANNKMPIIDLIIDGVCYESLCENDFFLMADVVISGYQYSEVSMFPTVFKAFAKSLCQKDTLFLVCQTNCSYTHKPDECEVIEVSSVEDAREKHHRFIAITDAGASNFCGGEVFRNGRAVGCFSYNGRLWSASGMSDDKIELNDFLDETHSKSLNA